MDWESFLFVSNVYKDAAIKNPNAAVVGEAHVSITSLVSHLQFHSKALHLEKTTDRLWRLERRLKNQNITFSFLNTEFEEIQNLIKFELDETPVVIIPKEKAKYFEKDGDDSLFGKSVYENFPAMREDIKNAGNCLAVDLHDGAIFYLMRIVEFGLRELGRNLGIKKIANAPLDYAGWQKVVNEIEEKLTKKIPTVRGPKQSEELKFKHDLLADFKAFEVKRNEALHGRGRYNGPEAIGFFDRANEFIQRLDKQISLSPAQKQAKLAKKLIAIYRKHKREDTK